MSYYFSVTLSVGFDEAMDLARKALQAEGFGIISEIDLQKAFHDKIGVDFRRYTILGACNPALAHEALKIEDKVGTMLPCNVIVQSLSDDQTEVAAVDPEASMQAIGNSELKAKAAEVAAKLKRAVEALRSSASVEVR